MFSLINFFMKIVLLVFFFKKTVFYISYLTKKQFLFFFFFCSSIFQFLKFFMYYFQLKNFLKRNCFTKIFFFQKCRFFTSGFQQKMKILMFSLINFLMKIVLLVFFFQKCRFLHKFFNKKAISVFFLFLFFHFSVFEVFSLLFSIEEIFLKNIVLLKYLFFKNAVFYLRFSTKNVNFAVIGFSVIPFSDFEVFFM